MSIADNATHRLLWLGRAHAIAAELQRLETLISLAMLTHPTGRELELLELADIQLGLATRALLEACTTIGALR